jgi:hypothetical protein
VDAYWLGTNTTVGRWNLLKNLRSNDLHSARWEHEAVFAREEETPGQFVARWSQRLTGAPLPEAGTGKLVAFLAQATGGKKDVTLDTEDSETWDRALDTLVMIGSSPEFQTR